MPEATTSPKKQETVSSSSTDTEAVICEPAYNNDREKALEEQPAVVDEDASDGSEYEYVDDPF